MSGINLSYATLGLSAAVSIMTALVTVFVTSALARRREHEADWRKLKLVQYQEFVLALSGIVEGRTTDAAQRRYSDAVNTLALVASVPVLDALRAFQAEITFVNLQRDQDAHDRLIDALLRTMRIDIQPRRHGVNPDTAFQLLGIPPEPAAQTIGKKTPTGISSA